MRYEFIVIGNDPAGLIAARAAAARNLRTAIVVPEMSLRSSEELSVCIRQMIPTLIDQQLSGDGPLNSHAVGVQNLARELQSIMHARRQRITDELNAHGIDQFIGDCEFINDQCVAVTCAAEQFTLHADQFVVATGTRTLRPSAIDFSADQIKVVEQFLETETQLPASVAIVGGNQFAMEFGLMLAALGSAVTMVNGREIPQLDDSVVGRLFDQAMDVGVKYLSQSQVIGVDAIADPAHPATRLYLDNGTQVQTQMTLWCDERKGNTEGMNLQKADACTDESFKLWCDHQMKTWNPRVAAIGNVVGFYQTEYSTVDAAEQIVNSMQTRGSVPRPIGLSRKNEIAKPTTIEF